MSNVLTQDEPLRLAVLVSGGGTTMVNLAQYIDQGELNATIEVVISSSANAKGVERAESRGYRTHVVDRKAYPTSEAMSEAIWPVIRDSNADLVCMAGFLCLISIPQDFQNRVMNIHPSLLPSFGGKGMYGKRVHQAVLDAGCKVSGCTVHFANEEYDRGPIIVQRTCPVEDGDTADTLASRVFEQECAAYPEAIRLFHAGRLNVEGGRVRAT